MLNKKSLLVLFLILSASTMLFAPKPAKAFSCTANGSTIWDTGIYTIPIDVTLTNPGDSVILADLSQSTTCSGMTGPIYYDALRVYAATISPLLEAKGYAGFLVVDSEQINFPISTMCVWANTQCGDVGTITTPLKVKIGIRSTNRVLQGITIPAGTEIASISMEQRSKDFWGMNKTWKFVLNSPLVIPSYTCNATVPESTVILPSVDAETLRNRGAGRYPGVKKTFSINLDCTPETAVFVTYSGDVMSGTNDVLLNKTSGNENVGIQILSGDEPLIFNGPQKLLIASSQAHQTLSYDAFYYYRDSGVRAGKITASAIFLFNYK